MIYVWKLYRWKAENIKIKMKQHMWAIVNINNMIYWILILYIYLLKVW